MLIKTVNLSKTYTMGKTKVEALRGVNLQINEGEFISIMGPSGSGKSTLLHLLGCLDTPSAGEYLLEGQKINKASDLARIRREKIGFVFQTFNLLPRESTLKNVELPMIYRGLSFHLRRQRAETLLQEVGLADRLTHKPNELSGGQRQRVAIARALANQPKIILADEPTGNLDSQSGREILELLQNLNRQQGVTLIVVTHEEYIAKRAERIVKLWDGSIVENV